MRRLKLGESMMKCPEVWQNFMASLDSKEEIPIDNLNGILAEYDAHIEIERVRKRQRRHRRWVYYYDREEYVVFDSDLGAIMFKMRWS